MLARLLLSGSLVVGDRMRGWLLLPQHHRSDCMCSRLHLPQQLDVDDDVAGGHFQQRDRSVCGVPVSSWILLRCRLADCNAAAVRGRPVQ